MFNWLLLISALIIDEYIGGTIEQKTYNLIVLVACVLMIAINDAIRASEKNNK